ncbi:hypothetical protein [Streptomyces sp. HD]|uniref:hypothetical protein n=1 Tax=Streptomyces sp. HD TaxID=3020892 RepID=UPI00232C21B2|nr:hypothetical protein [Streptomyces sp. HD]MDC0772853.1 hypothetical protein [Streptomyces sp. HD]
MPVSEAISASTISKDEEYEALIEATLQELSAAETEDVLAPLESGDKGPAMAWFIAT